LNYKELIDLESLPKHVAIIMDGNGRWAKSKGKNRVFGHRSGVKAVREATESAAEIGIKYLTLYAFSSENWNRPIKEVSALMELLVRTTKMELKTLLKNDIKLNVIGEMSQLPKRCQEELLEAIENTKNNQRMTLSLALSYSSRNEITNMVKTAIEKHQHEGLNPNEITPEWVSNHLYTSGIPDPELLIRTSGEYRISNFLLWQLAYSELYFLEKFWPDFNRDDLYKAIFDYQKRERRFGKTSEQLNA
jgi:undecaprenyl diphosphate synthase